MDKRPRWPQRKSISTTFRAVACSLYLTYVRQPSAFLERLDLPNAGFPSGPIPLINPQSVGEHTRQSRAFELRGRLHQQNGFLLNEVHDPVTEQVAGSCRAAWSFDVSSPPFDCSVLIPVTRETSLDDKVELWLRVRMRPALNAHLPDHRVIFLSRRARRRVGTLIAGPGVDAPGSSSQRSQR